jgi:hypothetical protein
MNGFCNDWKDDSQANESNQVSSSNGILVIIWLSKNEEDRINKFMSVQFAADDNL